MEKYEIFFLLGLWCLFTGPLMQWVVNILDSRFWLDLEKSHPFYANLIGVLALLMVGPVGWGLGLWCAFVVLVYDPLYDDWVEYRRAQDERNEGL